MENGFILSCSVCMWPDMNSTQHADSPVALFHPQFVSDLVCLLHSPLLTLLWSYFTLSKYVICSVCCNSPADPHVALFHPQFVCDLVCLLQFPLLTLLWPCSTLSLYVIWSVCCNSPCWPSCGLVPPLGCMWSGLFAAVPPADPLVALFHLQGVCDLVCFLQFPLLTLLWPCSTLSEYVIWSVNCNTPCRPFCGPVSPSASMWSLVCLMQFPLLTPLWLCSTLSMCVIWSVCCNSPCWPSCGLVPPSGCMWSGLFAAIPPADPLVALFHPQPVCDLVCLLQFPLLTLLWPCSTLREYVIWSVCCNSPCWPSCGLVPPSACMWSGLFAAIPPDDPFVALFHP